MKVEVLGRAQDMMTMILDYVQVAVGNEEQYKIVRSKLLRQYNDFARYVEKLEANDGKDSL